MSLCGQRRAVLALPARGVLLDLDIRQIGLRRHHQNNQTVQWQCRLFGATKMYVLHKVLVVQEYCTTGLASQIPGLVLYYYL